MTVRLYFEFFYLSLWGIYRQHWKYEISKRFDEHGIQHITWTIFILLNVNYKYFQS
jgi:hypothetical protein